MQIAALAPAAAFAASPFARAEVVASLKTAASTSDTDKDKFDKVISKLWAEFVTGATAGGTNGVTIGEGVFFAAFRRSGDTVIDNIKCFPDDGDEKLTSSCARDCGAAAAIEANGGVVTVDHFTEAWKATKLKYSPMVCRLKGWSQSKETSKDNDLLGFGC